MRLAGTHCTMYIHIHTVHILQEGLLVEKMAKWSATHENERPILSHIVTNIVLNYMRLHMTDTSVRVRLIFWKIRYIRVYRYIL